MNDVSKKVQSAYDQLVEAYAQKNHTPLSGSLEALAERLVQRLAPGEMILDIGCGTGRDLAWFASRGIPAVGVDLSAGMLGFAQAHVMGLSTGMPGTAQAHGMDLSARMLGIAKAHMEAPPSGAAVLAQMDMLKLGFGAGRFSGLWSCASLLHLPKVNAPIALAEFRRILRPGGTLAISIQGGAGEAWETGYGTPIERFFARYSLEEMAGLLAAAGFTILETFETHQQDKHWISYLCA